MPQQYAFSVAPKAVASILALLCVLTTVTAAHGAATPRPFQIDDLFELEDVGHFYGGPYAFSADGQKLAFTRVRGKKSLANHKWQYLWGNAGGDVWVQQHLGEAPVNITQGASDGSGWWSPQWSPDGERLALLSTRGGNVCVWMWTAKTGEMRQLSARGVALQDVHERPFLWIDNQHLLYPALAAGEQPLGMKIELQTPTVASKEWPKVVKGDQPTANVLYSGVPVDLRQRPQDDLLLIDVGNGVEKIVAQGTTRSWQLSPDKQTVVFTHQTSVYLPKADEKLPFDFSGLSILELARLDGKPVHLEGAMSEDILPDSVRWSPDGKALAFLGYAGGRDQPPRLYRLDVTTQKVTSTVLPALDAAPIVRETAEIEWTGKRELLIYAAPLAGDQRPGVTVRRDWWLIDAKGAAQCLTAAIKEPPKELWPADGRQSFFGVGAGKIWRIDTANAQLTDLTEKTDLEARAVAWPPATNATNSGTNQYRIPGRTYSQLVFSVRGGAEKLVSQTSGGTEKAASTPHGGANNSLVLLDARSGRLTPIASPDPKAELSAYDPLTRSGIFYASDRTGLRTWRQPLPNGSPQVLATANTFLRDIAEGEYKSMEYTSLNGAKLTGWLMLPYGYQPGHRYPLLTWVYAGDVYYDKPPGSMGIDSSLSLNLQIAAAHGYVVLFPSMPLAPEGATDDPMLRLTDGVLPAVDKAIESGIADPDHLFLMGQSFGGFSTYGLVTQTQRFKAAVSLAGLSDIVSLYGQFDARERYSNFPQETLFSAALMESAQVRMGNPPWKDLGRYIRNSPIFSVERVQTPLMIMQGDLDYVALQQGEEFFTSLYRQGKRAEFVRYWGEGHVLESPANIRDMWRRIFAWFDQF
jgi:dipeptidyl aminopeptidase/acylaminoacyl peptidase